MLRGLIMYKRILSGCLLVAGLAYGMEENTRRASRPLVLLRSISNNSTQPAELLTCWGIGDNMYTYNIPIAPGTNFAVKVMIPFIYGRTEKLNCYGCFLKTGSISALLLAKRVHFQAPGQHYRVLELRKFPGSSRLSSICVKQHDVVDIAITDEGGPAFVFQAAPKARL